MLLKKARALKGAPVKLKVKMMERTREELEHEDLERLYLEYMRGGLGLEEEAEKSRRAS